jgi:hypothetical protein
MPPKGTGGLLLGMEQFVTLAFPLCGCSLARLPFRSIVDGHTGGVGPSRRSDEQTPERCEALAMRGAATPAHGSWHRDMEECCV